MLTVSVAAYPGRIDLLFPNSLSKDANVSAIEIQTDGKILIAGEFTTVGSPVHNDLARLNADGSIDPTLDIGSGITSGSILVIKLQPDGKILLGGSFNSINGTFVRPIARLNTDGSLDSTFNVSGIDVTFVFDLDVQADGKILISASNLNGSSFITRLTSTGANDQGIGQSLFAASGGSRYTVSDVPAEGKILVGGNFTLGSNQGLARLASTGGVDMTFVTSIKSSVFDRQVHAKTIAGGKVLVWGKFDTVNDVPRQNIAILNNDGSLDTSFSPATTGTEAILSVAVQSDGKIIVGGRNFAVNNILRGNIGRLNANGTVDTTFSSGRGANSDVKTIKIQNSTRLLIGGEFLRYQFMPRHGLARTLL